MTDGTAGRMPAMKTVWIEQLRVVGLAIRREGALAALVLVLGSLALIAFSRMPVLQAMVDGEVGQLVFDPGEPPWGFFAVLAALLLPCVVWKGERRFGDTPLWSMPVDHRRHTLLKVAAGWVWLLAILSAALVWVTLTVLASGGALGVDEVRLLVLDPAGAAAGTPGAMESVNWTTPWWEWALPFTSATAAYLLASTLMLATRRPLFWAAGLWFAGAVVLGIADIRDIDWIQRASDFVAWYIGGDSFTRGMQLPTGGREVWTLLPSIQMWTASSAFWIGLGLVGVLGASGRARNH
ncbi:MAG: hypothetical protein OXH08_07610 [Gammaproteobacteria bacterium]|nr:hypothetical protein [Gammaproteobacteria bacterium]MDE0651079.1 hypothetical protein [Gammaproteobacteria bacterium]